MEDRDLNQIEREVDQVIIAGDWSDFEEGVKEKFSQLIGLMMGYEKTGTITLPEKEIIELRQQDWKKYPAFPERFSELYDSTREREEMNKGFGREGRYCGDCWVYLQHNAIKNPIKPFDIARCGNVPINGHSMIVVHESTSACEDMQAGNQEEMQENYRKILTEIEKGMDPTLPKAGDLACTLDAGKKFKPGAFK